ncbi:hypothetical protein T06_4082 [Trichinella sp. T6]|nr:hypothetical protein T06_15412 [Trichinella sp. T6]KRX51632.1 hypothetical protein T06_11048 [Trichinella sp. T6]KRX74798.1 hypothetical protein T06_4082 [Trichinella sp. T6]
MQHRIVTRISFLNSLQIAHLLNFYDSMAYPLLLPLTIMMSTLRTLICDASGKTICITMRYYVCAITDGKLGCSS